MSRKGIHYEYFYMPQVDYFFVSGVSGSSELRVHLKFVSLSGIPVMRLKKFPVIAVEPEVTAPLSLCPFSSGLYFCRVGAVITSLIPHRMTA